jgi:hypothetical protein
MGKINSKSAKNSNRYTDAYEAYWFFVPLVGSLFAILIFYGFLK